jgi:hypothetical protein
MALEQSIDYVNMGYLWVVDIDLEKFFDTVNQSKLVQLLSNTKKTVLDKKNAWMMANTRNKYWYVVGSGWMNIAIPNHYFDKAGYLSLTACYAEVRSKV